MSKLRDTLIILAALVVIGGGVVHAQAITSATPYSFSVTGTFANCPAVVAGTTQYCFSTTGISESISGAAWVPVGGAAATGVQKVQGVLPGATGNVSVSCTASFPSMSASFSAGTSTTAQVPTATLPVTCTGSGS
jgi:hypothetical protein